MPTTFIGLLLFVVLLAPGFAFLLRRERLSAHRSVSTFRETVQLVFVSLLADAAAISAFALLRTLAPHWAPDTDALVRNPGDYATTHYGELLAWGTGLLTTAVLAATAAASRWPWALLTRLPVIGARTNHKTHDAYVSAWWLMFSEHPGTHIHLGCVLEDGSYVAGRLWSFSRSAEDIPDREITLTGPITYRPSHAADATELPGVGAASLSARRIILLTVSYVDPNRKSDQDRRVTAPDPKIDGE